MPRVAAPDRTQDERARLDRVYAAYESGEFQDGLRECEALLAVNKACAEAHNLRGILLEELNRPRDAIAAYRQAYKIDHKITEARHNELALTEECLTEAARLYEGQQDYEQALECCDLYLEAHPDCAEAHNLRGCLLEEMDRPYAARQAYRRALRRNPDLQGARENLAWLEESLEGLTLNIAHYGPVASGAAHPVGKSFAPRAGAYAIDWLVFATFSYFSGALAAFLVIIMLVILGRFTGNLPSNPTAEIVVGIMAYILYFALCEWLCGATPGKLLLRMRVVNDGSARCRFPAALKRGLARFFDGLFFGLVAYFNMHAPDYKRLGDEWARTTVISVNSIQAEQRRSGWWAALALTIFLCLTACTYGICTLVVSLN